MTKPSEDDQLLDKEARKWVTKVTKENRAIQETRRQMELLRSGAIVNADTVIVSFYILLLLLLLLSIFLLLLLLCLKYSE